MPVVASRADVITTVRDADDNDASAFVMAVVSKATVAVDRTPEASKLDEVNPPRASSPLITPGAEGEGVIEAVPPTLRVVEGVAERDGESDLLDVPEEDTVDDGVPVDEPVPVDDPDVDGV